jgi:hypothetical protein
MTQEKEIKEINGYNFSKGEEEELTLAEKWNDFCFKIMPFWLFDLFFHSHPIKEVKYFFQRFNKGYCDRDLWNLNDYLTEKIRPALKAFAKEARNEEIHGYPSSCICSEEDKKTCKCDKECATYEDWVNILNKIEEAFDLLWEDDNCTDEWYAKTTEQHVKDNEKIEEGLRLFAKYYRALWD